jgi:hypothetical protein
LLFVACVCASLAWERHVVLTRRDVRAAWSRDTNVDFRTAADVATDREKQKRVQRLHRNTQGCVNADTFVTVSWYRRLLRDEAVHTIAFCGADHKQVDLAIHWFPEAVVFSDGVQAAGPRGMASHHSSP